MARLFWIAVGAGAGVYAVRKLTRTVEQYTPAAMGDSFSASLASVGDGLREIAEVIREGMAEREQELRAALGVDASDGPAMDARAAQSLIENPTGPGGYDSRRDDRYDEDEFGFDQPGGPRQDPRRY